MMKLKPYLIPAPTATVLCTILALAISACPVFPDDEEEANGGEVEIPLKGEGGAIIIQGNEGRVIVGQAGGKVQVIDGNQKKEETISPLTEQISRHIHRLAEEEREKRMDFMQVVIDDVARLCELDEEQQQRLRLAAKGATERSMSKWHEQAERYFRSRLNGSDEDTAKEILENMGSVNFGGRDAEKEGESQDLWKETLSEVLSEEQVDKYEEVVEQRHADRVEAFAGISLSSIDSHLRLTPEQKKKLSVLIDASAAEYLEEVQRYWGDYYERGMLMSLANASEDTQLKEILTDNQFKRLKSATASFDHFWDQKKRAKRAKEKAREKAEERQEKEPVIDDRTIGAEF